MPDSPYYTPGPPDGPAYAPPPMYFARHDQPVRHEPACDHAPVWHECGRCRALGRASIVANIETHRNAVLWLQDRLRVVDDSGGGG